jgi:GTP pyrophosphokinase
LLSGVGFGKFSARQVLNKLEPGSTNAAEPEAESASGVIGNTLGQMSDAVKRVFFGKGSDSLQVEGQDDLLVYRARCCNPIRGEEIIGYVTRGKGVAVHARSCPNVQNLLYESDRRIQVEWAPLPGDTGAAGAAKMQTYPVKLTVLCDDRAGLLKEFTAIISDDGTNIRSSASNSTADGGAVIDFVIETVDVRHLNRLVDKMRRVQGVRDVQRVQKI